MDLPSPLNPFPNIFSTQGIDHLTSSSLYTKSNGFIECQIKTIKISLTIAKASGISIDHLLQMLRSTPIGPNLPFLHEILHNHTDESSGQPSTPIYLEHVRDHLITKKTQQKNHHDKRYRTQPLSDLSPGQDVLFLSLTDQTSYLEGTILGPAHTPRSYLIEAQGCRYRCNRQHI